MCTSLTRICSARVINSSHSGPAIELAGRQELRAGEKERAAQDYS